jgi:uncharacterized LabA/DUF88 family protein
LKYAILIDAENAQHKSIPGVLRKISSMGGVATVKRAYGNFDNANLFACWEKLCAEHSFSRVQASQYVSGKSTTDLVLTMDAIQLLYTNPAVNGFAIVSSDSDFTGLAKKLRKGGKYVIGFGKQSTLAPLVDACDTFAYVDELSSSILPKTKLQLFQDTINQVSNKDGWANLAKVGALLIKSDINVQDDEYKLLTHFFKDADSHFEIKLANHDCTYSVRNKYTAACTSSKPYGTCSSSEELSRAHLELLRKSVKEGTTCAQGWAHLGMVGTALVKSKFNYKEYGYSTLISLFRSRPTHFEVKMGKSEAWVRCPSGEELSKAHLELFRKSVKETSGAQGWAYLGKVDTALVAKSKFNYKLYGYKTLIGVFHSQPIDFEVKRRQTKAWVRCRT